jgi:hypothetical protein
MMGTSSVVSLAHLDRMTDSTGLIQHAIYGVPRRESGYTIDDNARALRLCARLWRDRPSHRMLDRTVRFLSLLEFARRPGGGFHNLMSYQRQWLDTDVTGDCQGQAIRALAEVLGSPLPEDHRRLARELIDAALPMLAEQRSLRAQAYVILAMGHLRRERVPAVDRLECIAASGARQLAERFARSRKPGWTWFESRLTYANAVLPHALLVAGELWPAEAYLEIGQEAFAFLEAQTVRDGAFRPVGNDGWFAHGDPKAEYDQQPIEAVTMADAALEAARLLDDPRHLRTVALARRWFYGGNSQGAVLADARSGSCCDGLQPNGVNRNQGAESTLAYLWTEIHYRDGHPIAGSARAIADDPCACPGVGR